MDRNIDSQIFQVIDDMDEYIAGCKPKMFSGSEIIVDRETMEEYLRDLRRKAPDEIERYRKIISNRDAILEDAKQKAQGLIDEATAQTSELVSKEAIIKMSYEQADEMMKMAEEQAQGIVDAATLEANNVRKLAADYMEDVMNYLETLISSVSRDTQAQFTNLANSLSNNYERIRADHAQLHQNDAVQPAPPEEVPAGEDEE